MADLQLTQTSQLGGYDHDFGHAHLRELVSLSIVSIAMPQGGEKNLNTAMKSAYGIDLPTAPTSIVSKKKPVRVIQTQMDQWFVIIEQDSNVPLDFISNGVAKHSYLTDQTHGWIGLEISGVGAQEALLRICPIDLDISVFPIDSAARTAMEHMGVLILRTDNDRFQLFSASSSAKSFLHMVETSINYTG